MGIFSNCTVASQPYSKCSVLLAGCAPLKQNLLCSDILIWPQENQVNKFLLIAACYELPSKMSLPPQVCWDNCMWSVPLFSSIKTKAVSFMLFSGADHVLNLTCLDWSLPRSSYRCSLMLASLKGGGFGRWAKMGHRGVAATTSHCAEVRTVCLLMVLV